MGRFRINSISPSIRFLVRKYILKYIVKITSYLLYMISPILPISHLNLEKPIFVIGCSRSGTSLFKNMFAHHEELANWTEAPQIFELDYYDPRIDHVKLAEDAGKFTSFRIRAMFSLFTKLKRKKRFVNKHPQNSLRIQFIKAIFPDAIFIHIIRDGRAVIQSNYYRTCHDTFRKSIPFGNFPKPPRWRQYMDLPLVYQFAHQWVDLVNYIQADAKTHLNDRDFIEVTYEEFCRQPHRILMQIDLFCGLDPNKRYYEKIPNVFKSQNFKWRKELSDIEINQIQSIIGECMRELGY